MQIRVPLSDLKNKIVRKIAILKLFQYGVLMIEIIEEKVSSAQWKARKEEYFQATSEARRRSRDCEEITAEMFIYIYIVGYVK